MTFLRYTCGADADGPCIPFYFLCSMVVAWQSGLSAWGSFYCVQDSPYIVSQAIDCYSEPRRTYNQVESLLQCGQSCSCTLSPLSLPSPACTRTHLSNNDDMQFLHPFRIPLHLIVRVLPQQIVSREPLLKPLVYILGSFIWLFREGGARLRIALFDIQCSLYQFLFLVQIQ